MKTKSPLTPWKLGSIKQTKYWFGLSVDIFDWYLFHLNVLLKPDFSSSNRFVLSCVYKVTTGAQSFVSVIENVVPWFALSVATIMHILDQFRSRLISKLMKCISGILQKLLRYFNGTIISTLFVPSFPVYMLFHL